MRPESSADYLRSLVGLPIADAVPQDIQQVLLRLRLVFHHGLFDYELFTAAGDLAYLAVGGALRRRFILAYDGRVPFVKDDHREELVVTDFDNVHKAIHRGAYAPGKGWRLAGIATGVHPGFNASFTGLLQWARREKLLSGQRNRVIEGAIVRLRNYVAHPERYHLISPVDAAYAVRDAIEIVNRLWGATTEGGRLYPGSLRREPVVLARSPDASSQTSFHPSLLPHDVDEHGNWDTVILLAVPRDELWSYCLGFETTFHSTRLLWGPGPMTGALDAWQREGESWTGDTVEVLDRVFFVRYPPGADTPELPRSRETAAACPEEEQLRRWLVIVADTPFAALAHARRHVIGHGAMQRGWCEQCQTTSFGVHETLAEALDMDTNGADHA